MAFLLRTFCLSLIVGSILAVGPFDYTIHTFDGHCNPDGTCEYVLRIPAGSAISGVMDNTTANAIVAHLSRHDDQILGLMTFFGNKSDNPNMINVLQELSNLKNLESRVQSELDLMVTDVLQLRKDNEMLKQQVLWLNNTLEKEGKHPCTSSPCVHGTCVRTGTDSFSCICMNGYSGQMCDSDVDECAANPCARGTCNNTQGSYYCKCPLGYTGQFCGIDINECMSDPCENGASCVDGIGNFTCYCKVGFNGTNCEQNVNDCTPNPCLNGGVCLDDIASYYCFCPPGYEGTKCETDVDECARSNPCGAGTCHNINGSFECACPPGVRGVLCEISPMRDCYDLKTYFNMSTLGVYGIVFPEGNFTLASCDMATDNGGWTLIQRRVSDAVDFNRNWTQYRDGFGELSANFWWGLQRVHNVITNRSMILRIDMWDWEGGYVYAEYDQFTLSDEAGGYKLNVAGYRGNAGDAINYPASVFASNHMKFSTFDRDQDTYYGNCAQTYGSGWWHNACWAGDLNGKFYNAGPYTSAIHNGIEWYPWRHTSSRYSMKKTEMKFRPSTAPSKNSAPFL
ncbi:hypothetical protein ACJMK2_010502 [Sinanodonta woodiana]|uniref:Fibrinogen C-terminal domain-containing protein n=1 Tax=Sinanodonta woodiana TaxID=1069815 RepID=A0ABD3VGU1_SINWO